MSREIDGAFIPEEREHLDRFDKAVERVFRQLARNIMLGGHEPTINLADLQQDFGLSEPEAQKAIDEANRSINLALEDAGLSRIVKGLVEDHDG